MLTIEQYVIEAFQHGLNDDQSAESGHYEKGLFHICPAIEATARKYFLIDRATRSNFLDFVRSHYDLLEFFAAPGVNFTDTTLEFLNLEDDWGNRIENPDFASVIYHVFRCQSAHGKTLNPSFSFDRKHNQLTNEYYFNLQKGEIRFPKTLLWGLIAMVVFCRANRDIRTDTHYWFTWSTFNARRKPPYRFDLDWAWGAHDTIRNFRDKVELPHVALKT